MKVIVGLVSNVSVFLQAAVDEGLLDFVELSGIVFLWSNLRLIFHDLGLCLLGVGWVLAIRCKHFRNFLEIS